MRYPNEFIERLRDALPISAVIGRRVTLRKHGREFQALCPFHKEKSPSFTVNDEKGFYHCFGCGAHGDTIGFIREFEGVNYPEAIERLASEAGVPLPKFTREAEAEEKKRLGLQDAVNVAAQWFTEQLATPAGKEARDYLATRGMSAEMIRTFGLGFAPNLRGALRQALTAQGFTETMLAEAGLIARTDDGSLYDRFRGRLMFPIKSAQGKVIAFGGRILPSAETANTAKYLNSPETPLFKKGENLFAYDIARRAGHEKDSLIIAEGYMDVIALHQAGFTHAVAPLGTAVTEGQLKLAWRVAREPILCLDGDKAGLAAAMRAARTALPLVRPDMGLRFAVLPAGEDPDSLIRKSGANAMQEALARAKVLSQVLWESALAHYGSATAEQRAALEQHLNETANLITDPGYKKHLQVFFRDSVFALSRPVRKAKVNAGPNVPLRTLPEADADAIHLIPIENQIITIILLHPALLRDAHTEEQFAHLDFSQSELDKLRANILEIVADSVSFDSESLCAAIAKRGLGEKVNSLLHSERAVLSLPLASQITLDGLAAARAFEGAYLAYTLKKVEQDMHEAAHQMEHAMTEDSYSRFIALKQQWESLHRSRYSVTHDEQFS